MNPMSHRLLTIVPCTKMENGIKPILPDFVNKNEVNRVRLVPTPKGRKRPQPLSIFFCSTTPRVVFSNKRQRCVLRADRKYPTTPLNWADSEKDQTAHRHFRICCRLGQDRFVIRHPGLRRVGLEYAG